MEGGNCFLNLPAKFLSVEKLTDNLFVKKVSSKMQNAGLKIPHFEKM